MNDSLLRLFHNSNISIYRLSRRTGIPYTTVYELVHGKKDINQRPVETVKRIAVTLGCSIEELLNPIHFMDGVSGRFRGGISYTWRYDSVMVLRVKEGKHTTEIKTNLQMTDLNSRNVYDGVADAYIQQYLKQKKLRKRMEEIKVC